MSVLSIPKLKITLFWFAKLSTWTTLKLFLCSLCPLAFSFMISSTLESLVPSLMHLELSLIAWPFFSPLLVLLPHSCSIKSLVPNLRIGISNNIDDTWAYKNDLVWIIVSNDLVWIFIYCFFYGLSRSSFNYIYHFLL